jgi:hypothetical protein
MPGSQANRRRAGNHYRGVDGVGRFETEFFHQLSFDRLPRVLPRFHMASRWQPKLGIFVIYEKNLIVIYHSKV